MSDQSWTTEFAQLWKEVLGVEAVHEQDDFFDLGGHSLSALRLSTLIRQELNLAVLLQHVLDNPRYGDLLAIAGAVSPERVEVAQGEHR
ncbi:phosphopantetheine-binding protein [Actinokineospora diospyrosa]|uniref:Phosphopantetheine attachment site n=1 Tax=Actinokineospora diospyrosa TaxID=103728 RepID=A0ABT1IG37_9PSEU|nr:phosphopantetheine-binding protein [Actinokineospora diospyrosa]MCP2271574.1 Phosphopantetheine attachment site [Actinokineospora diospyrosa]